MSTIIVTDRDDRQHQVEAVTGLPLMETLRDLEYGVAAICGGQCCCGTCHVYIAEDWLEQLPPPAGDEIELVQDLEFRQPNSRLSCQLIVSDALNGLPLKLAPEE